jgi:hypothetical protein
LRFICNGVPEASFTSDRGPVRRASAWGRYQANRAPLELVDAAIARAKTTRPDIKCHCHAALRHQHSRPGQNPCAGELADFIIVTAKPFAACGNTR